MSLFCNISIDIEEVRRVVRENWNVEVIECIKVSQNHTFLAKDDSMKQFVVRVTPDPENKRFKSIELEVALLKYLHDNKLSVCRAIPSLINSSAIVRKDSLTLCLFEFATGEPIINNDSTTWITNKEIVVGLGRWFARLHKLTRRFVEENPTLVAHAPHWASVHEGILAGVEVDQRDQKLISDSTHFGLIHGDVNPTNFFWNSSLKTPCMFDWDQIQQSWFLYDLAGPIWIVIILELAGSSTDRKPVPEANSERYINWLLEGYETENDGVAVDRQALHRMVMIRRILHKRFCRGAVGQPTLDPTLKQFCEFMNEFFDNEEKTQKH